jgi:hypothetical protein
MENLNPRLVKTVHAPICSISYTESPAEGWNFSYNQKKPHCPTPDAVARSAVFLPAKPVAVL